MSSYAYIGFYLLIFCGIPSALFIGIHWILWMCANRRWNRYDTLMIFWAIGLPFAIWGLYSLGAQLVHAVGFDPLVSDAGFVVAAFVFGITGGLSGLIGKCAWKHRGVLIAMLIASVLCALAAGFGRGAAFNLVPLIFSVCYGVGVTASIGSITQSVK